MVSICINTEPVKVIPEEPVKCLIKRLANEI
jgi:hypothetical protein